MCSLIVSNGGWNCQSSIVSNGQKSANIGIQTIQWDIIFWVKSEDDGQWDIQVRATGGKYEPGSINYKYMWKL